MVKFFSKPARKCRLDSFMAMEACPHIQPIICSDTQQLIGAEVLLRFRDNKGNYFTADAALEELETPSATNIFIVKLINDIHDFFYPLRHNLPQTFFFTFNVCTSQIIQSEFKKAVYRFTDSFNIMLEFSERCFESMEDRALDTIQKMMDEGIQFSIDNFGAGGSGLKYLENMEFCQLKLSSDLTLIYHGELVYKKTLSALSGLAVMLNVKLAAEGIQSEGQAQLLVERGVNMMQGQLYSQPLTMNNFVSSYVS